MGHIDPGTTQTVEFITADIPPVPAVAKLANARSRLHVEKRHRERSSDEVELKPHGKDRDRKRTPRYSFERKNHIEYP